MIGFRLKSAIFIDYENVGHRALPDTIQNWLAWLERGEFDPKRKRRTFLDKRVYWNSTAHHLRDKFRQSGFRPVLCERFAGLKNAADIRMAIDVIEATISNPNIKEFILVTQDSDFVPVLQKLRERRRRTAVLADQSNPARFTTYRTHADIVIPLREFMEATKYIQPPPRKLVRRALSRLSRITAYPFSWTANRISATVRERATKRAAKKARADTAVQEAEAVEKSITAMELAAEHVNRIASLKPNQATARKDIERELAKISGFSKKPGPKGYLGTGSYRSLMEKVAKKTDRITIRADHGGGISVWYIPKDEE